VRLLFIGTPACSAVMLEPLVSEGLDVVAAVTRPARPRGRGLHAHPSPVAETAGKLGVPVHTPARLTFHAFGEVIRARTPDLALIFAFGEILSEDVVAAMPILNVHLSLLPRWRGPAPVVHTILAGDAVTGVTLQRVVYEVDAGDVLAQREYALSGRETAGELERTLTGLGAELVVEVLREHRFAARPQTGEVTTAPKIRTRDARLDWNASADELDRRVRAFNPKPGAHTMLRLPDGRRTRMRILYCEPTDEDLEPGRLVPRGEEVIAGCGDGALKLLEVQPAGKRVLSSAEFVHGYLRREEARLE